MSARGASIAALLLGGLVAGFAVRPHRLADASSYVMMADSLWNDGDLVYEPADLARADVLAFEDHPGGMFLVERPDGTFTYGKPPSYAFAALPFYALCGVRGFFVLNGLLLAGLVAVGGCLLADRAPWPRALAASACVVGGSVTSAYLHWIDPFLFGSLLVAAALLAWRAGRPALCGACLAVLGSVRAPYLLLAAAPALLALIERRPRALVRLAIGALAAAALLGVATLAAGGDLVPYVGSRRLGIESMPFTAGPADRGVGFVIDRVANLAPSTWPSLGDFARSNLYFWLGRFGGVVPYFPAFVASLLFAAPWKTDRVVWLAAAGGVCAALQLLLPWSFQGGAHALGNRYFVLLPIGLQMIDSVTIHRGRMIAAAALVAMVAPVMIAPAYYSVHVGEQMLEAPLRWLPFEWTQAAAMDLPIRYPGGLYALTDRQFGWEADEGGLWTVGGARAELVFVRRGPRAPVVRLWSHLPRAVVYDGDERREIALGQGDVEIVLRRPMASFVDKSRHIEPRIAVYRLVVEAPGGFRPIDLGLGTDRRYLGVFVRPVE